MSHRPVRSLLLASMLTSTLAVSLVHTAISAPVLGFREDFSAAGTGGWSGGVASFVNPGTGGYLGAGDGFLQLGTISAANWGARCRLCPEYSGDWNAAGITQVRLWLNDVGTAEPFEVHVALGDDLNFWQYNIGFVPTVGAWTEHIVDLTSTGDFTQIIGSGSLAAALANVSVFLIRHDRAPFMQIPDQIQGTAGIDRILLTNGLVGVDSGPGVAARPIRLAPPFPNPSRGPVTFAMESFDGGAVSIRIVDLQGRIVRRAELSAGPAGPRTWLWDGLDGAGRRVSPGQYRVQATGPSGGTGQPLIRVD